MGRGPKATISFTYCMARAELNAGGGPKSEVDVAASSATGADVAVSFGAAAASFSRAQADKAIARDKQNVTAINKRGRLSRFCRTVDVIEIFSPLALFAVL